MMDVFGPVDVSALVVCLVIGAVMHWKLSTWFQTTTETTSKDELSKQANEFTVRLERLRAQNQSEVAELLSQAKTLKAENDGLKAEKSRLAAELKTVRRDFKLLAGAVDTHMAKAHGMTNVQYSVPSKANSDSVTFENDKPLFKWPVPRPPPAGGTAKDRNSSLGDASVPSHEALMAKLAHPNHEALASRDPIEPSLFLPTKYISLCALARRKQETSLESSLEVSVDSFTRRRARVLKELREPLKPKLGLEAPPPPRPGFLLASA
jgi:hypothetical protein